MRVTIVGFPYSGKTALFQALTGLSRDTLKPTEENLAAVHIHEPRLDYLAELYSPKKRTEPTLEFFDLPGGGADQEAKAGLEDHLPTLRQSDALLVVLRAFKSDGVPMHQGRIDPARDLVQIREEMLLADLMSCAGRLEKVEKSAAKPSKDREQQLREIAVLQKCKAALESEQPLSTVLQPGDEEKLVRSFGFMTQKPVVVVVNVGETEVGKPPPFVDPHAVETLAVCASLEAELMQMDPNDRPAFMADYGLASLARDRIVQASFRALNMIVFLTAGPEEVRSWPIPKGFTAVDAAGKIHSDLARGFIKAETIAYEDLKAAGSMRDAKASNKVRQEPKTYVVQDGDVILFKHSG